MTEGCDARKSLYAQVFSRESSSGMATDIVCGLLIAGCGAAYEGGGGKPGGSGIVNLKQVK